MKTKILLASLFVLVAPLSIAAVGITFGVSTYQNRRPYQEDRFTHAILDNGEFFGVYDGHGGDKVSSLLKNNLHIYFANAKGSIEQKFQRAFEEADYIAQNFWPEEGSTAVVACIDKDNTLYFAWAGDSRAVLGCGGKVCSDTQDHKPDRPDEKQRIEQAGGNVVKWGVWRVNGLAVSRSIGDAACKLQGIGQIIATPEYAQVQLKPDNNFLILASDGVWDEISSEEAVAIVNRELRNKLLLNDIAKTLQDAAIAKGSGDNITVCVVQFDWSPVSIPRKWWNWLWGK